MNATNKTRKGALVKTLLAIGIAFVAFLCVITAILLTQKPKDLQISNIDMAKISDGVYTGGADNGLVKATVSVEVRGGAIINISVLEHEQLLGKKAEKIIDNIIAQQSLGVDAITSATYSSDTLRKAVENALRQGE